MQTVTIPLNILLAANVIAAFSQKRKFRKRFAAVHVKPTGKPNEKGDCPVDVVSTDGLRLLVLHGFAVYSGETCAFTIPTEVITQAGKQVGKKFLNLGATFRVGENRVTFTQGDFSFGAEYGATFPQYEMVIPKHPEGNPHGAIVFNGELMAGFSKARAFLNDSENNVLTIRQAGDHRGVIVVEMHGVDGYGLIMPIDTDGQQDPFKRLPNP